MVIKIEGQEIADCWEQIVVEIIENGHYVNDERGSLTKEILNVVTCINDPFGVEDKDFFSLFHTRTGFPVREKSKDKDFSGLSLKLENIRIPDNYFWEGDKLQLYSRQFISDKNPGFVYTYGNRLRAYFKGVDQIQRAIDRLKQCRESRRAISITWDPVLDSEADEVPCMILIDFKIRDNLLYTTALWRSHDIYGAWFPNAVGLAYLSKYVTEEIKEIGLGPITIHSVSAHIYENNFEEAKKVKTKKK